MTVRDRSCAIKRWKKYRWHNVVFFPSNRFVPDVWILIISLGLNSRHSIDFCLMGEWERESIPVMVFTGNVLPLLLNLSKQTQKSQISKWASESSFVLAPIFISPVIDRLENSFVKTCGRILKRSLSTGRNCCWASVSSRSHRKILGKHLREVPTLP